jgi:hypothetical protein
MLCAVDDVPADDPTFIGRDRGKFRGFGNGVAADIHRRVRRRAQARIESDAEPLDPPDLGPVWIATPIRSVSPRSCATASRLSSSLGNALAQHIVRGDHQPGAGKRQSARH